jgi:transposase
MAGTWRSADVFSLEGDDRTSTRHRRSFRAEDKRRIVAETRAEGASVCQVARKYAICPSQLFRWRRLVESGVLDDGASARAPQMSVCELRREVVALRRQLANKRVECQILAEALHNTRSRDVRKATSSEPEGSSG